MDEIKSGESIYQHAIVHFSAKYAHKTPEELQAIGDHVEQVRAQLETQRLKEAAGKLSEEEGRRVVKNWMWTLGRMVVVQRLMQGLPVDCGDGTTTPQSAALTAPLTQGSLGAREQSAHRGSLGVQECQQERMY